MADLRDSGSLEQDADVVLFVHREEFYEERRRPSDPKSPAYIDWMARMAACANKAEIIIDKNRHGQRATVALQFDGPTMRFSNPAHTDACSR
jgi:replicative DNA helicase